MALAETTLSSACGVNDKSIVVASATSVAAGRYLRIDDEVMQVTKDYTSGTTVGVLRGLNGSAQAAHVSSARVVHGDGTDFQDPGVGRSQMFPQFRNRETRSYIAAGAIALPTAGRDMLAAILGTDALAMTLANPTKEMDGSILTVASVGGAAHTLTYTAGFGGAGSGYDVITFPASKTSISFIAYDEVWIPYPGPYEGTVTAIDLSIA